MGIREMTSRQLDDLLDEIDQNQCPAFRFALIDIITVETNRRGRMRELNRSIR
jgi:hypothetical protein